MSTIFFFEQNLLSSAAEFVKNEKKVAICTKYNGTKNSQICCTTNNTQCAYYLGVIRPAFIVVVSINKCMFHYKNFFKRILLCIGLVNVAA